MSDAADEAEYEHSADLFRPGEPMHFCMRPCSERARLKGVIEHGGGTISAKFFGNNSIKLVPPDCQVFEGVCYSSQYVWDCVAANKRLCMKKYKRVEKVAEQMSDDSDDGRSDNVRTMARVIGKRTEYGIADDLEIIRHILKIGEFGNIMGNTLWKSMEQLKITSKPRSWQSMKERFKKKILPSINSYPLTKEEIQLFNKRENRSVVATDEPIPSKWYTLKEDGQIVKYILDHRFFEDLKGNQIWKRMEANGVTRHSWQSMKERFRKKIVNNLHNFKIPPTHRGWIERAFGIESSSPEASDRMSREATPDSTVSSPPKSSRMVDHDGWLRKDNVRGKENKSDGVSNKRLRPSRGLSSEEDIAPPSSKRSLLILGADQPSTSGQLGSNADRQKNREKANSADHQAGGTKGMPGGRRFVTLDSSYEDNSQSSSPQVIEVKVAPKDKAGMRMLAPTKIVPLLLQVTPEPQVDRGKALFRIRPPPESCEMVDETPPLSRPNCSLTRLNMPEVNVEKNDSPKVVVPISAASNGDASERLNVNEDGQEINSCDVSVPSASAFIDVDDDNRLPCDDDVVSKCDYQSSAEENNGHLRASDSPLIGHSLFRRRLLGLSPLANTDSSLPLVIGDHLSLSSSSQESVVRPATFAAAKDLDGIKRITRTEPVTSSKVLSSIPELATSAPSPILEPVPLTRVMNVEPTRKPPKTTLVESSEVTSADDHLSLTPSSQENFVVGPLSKPPKTRLERPVSNEVISVDDHLSLSSSSQDDVVRPATFAAANDLDAINRITCTEPVRSTKVRSPLPELDTTVPIPITEHLPLTTAMPVEPTRKPPKTTLVESSEVTSADDHLSLTPSSQENFVVGPLSKPPKTRLEKPVSNEVISGDDHLSLSSSSQDDVVRPATFAAANDLDGIKRITCTEPVTSTKVQSPLPELDTTVPSPILEPLALITVMPVERISKPPTTTLEEPSEVTSVDDHLSLSSSSQDDCVVRPVTLAATKDLDGINPIIEPFTSTRVPSPLLAEPLALTTARVETRRPSKTTFEESNLTFRRDEEPNAAVAAAATLDDDEHGEEEEVRSNSECIEKGLREPTGATALHGDDEKEEDQVRSNLEFAEERLRVMVEEEEKEMEVDVEVEEDEEDDDDSVVGKAVSQSLDFSNLRNLGEELEKDINSWIERSNPSSQIDSCFTESSDDNARTTSMESDEAEGRLQDDARVENSSQNFTNVEFNVPDVDVRKPPLEKPCLCKCLCENCDDTDSDAVEMPDIPEGDDRPEGLKKLLDGCQELSSKDGIAILKWSAYKLGMSKEDLLKYYRGIVAHDLDTHLESI